MIPLNTGVGAFSGCYGMKLDSSSTDTNLFPSGAGAPVGLSYTQWQYPGGVATGAIPSYFSFGRIVSAGVVVDYLGAPLSAKGKMTLAAAPRNVIRTEMDTGNISVDRISRIPGSLIMPINHFDTGVVTYRPMDALSTVYTDVNTSTTHTISSINDWQDLYAKYCGEELFVIVSGATATDSCQATVVVNLELIPRENTLDLLGSTPSPSDPVGFADSQNVARQIPQTSEVKDDDTLLNMVSPLSGLHEGPNSELKTSMLGGIHTLICGLPEHPLLDSRRRSPNTTLRSSGRAPRLGRTAQRSVQAQNLNFIDKLNSYLRSMNDTVNLVRGLNPINDSDLLSLAFTLI
jgi:hypothetical protein